MASFVTIPAWNYKILPFSEQHTLEENINVALH
jgi:hypothetical protein